MTEIIIGLIFALFTFLALSHYAIEDVKKLRQKDETVFYSGEWKPYVNFTKINLQNDSGTFQ